MMPTEVVGSRFPVGSSAIRIIGRLTNARAIATRCCSPPDSSSGIRSPLPSRPTISSVSGTSSAISELDLPITCSANAHVLGDGLVLQQPEVLEDGADLAAQPRHLPPGEAVDLLAGDVHPARGGAVLAQHQAQERGLARSGGADEEDELALLDVDRHLVECGASLAGIGLDDLLEADHRIESSRGDNPAGAPGLVGCGGRWPGSRSAFSRCDPSGRPPPTTRRTPAARPGRRLPPSRRTRPARRTAPRGRPRAAGRWGTAGSCSVTL